jgi:hypothetical protein
MQSSQQSLVTAFLHWRTDWLMRKMFNISSAIDGTSSGKWLVTSYHCIMKTNGNKLLWWVEWTSQITTIHQYPRTTGLVDKNQTGRQSERRLDHNSLSLHYARLQTWSSESDSTRRQVSTFTVNFKTTNHSPMLWNESAKLTKKLNSREMFQTSDTPTRSSNRSSEMKKSVTTLQKSRQHTSCCYWRRDSIRWHRSHDWCPMISFVAIESSSA